MGWHALDQLSVLQRDCHFRYLRFHGLLSDEMAVCAKAEDGKLLFNWQYIDLVFDEMLKRGIRPLVELGFMPDCLKSGDTTIFWWKGNVTPPENLARWGELITALTRHGRNRAVTTSSGTRNPPYPHGYPSAPGSFYRRDKEFTLSYQRIDRISEEVRREVDAIIRDQLHDPRIRGTYSVTRADVTRDLSYAKIYVSVLEEADRKPMMAALKSAAGYIRHGVEVGRNAFIVRSGPDSARKSNV